MIAFQDLLKRTEQSLKTLFSSSLEPHPQTLVQKCFNKNYDDAKRINKSDDDNERGCSMWTQQYRHGQEQGRIILDAATLELRWGMTAPEPESPDT